MQQFLVYFAVAIAVGFLVKKFFLKKKSKKNCGGGDGCGC